MVRIRYDGVLLNDDAAGFQVDFPEDMGTPPIRGSNLTIPFRHGAVPTAKFYGERTLVLQGFVSAPDRATLWHRIDVLKRLFLITRGARRLEVEWPDGTRRYLLAEPRNTLGFSGKHRHFSPFSVEFACPDPFWRDDAAAQEASYRLNTRPAKRLGDPTLILADRDSTYDAVVVQAVTDMILPNSGSFDIEDARIRLTTTYPLTDIQLWNRSNGSKLRLACPIPAGGRVEIDCGKWRAYLTTPTDRTELTAFLTTPVGQRSPLILPPSPSTLRVSLVSAGSYRVSLAIFYAAAYL